jgi:hypothetical protein
MALSLHLFGENGPLLLLIEASGKDLAMRFAHHLHTVDFESQDGCVRCRCVRAVFKRGKLWVLTALAFSVVLAPAVRAQSHWAPVFFENGSNSMSLPSVAQARISAALGRDQRVYQAMAQDGGFHMTNRKNRFAANFRPARVELRVGAERWGMTLKGYGFGDKLRSVRAAARGANANRVQYARGELTEWYGNGPFGLEQGFTLRLTPGKSNGEPLTLTLALSGSLSAFVDPGARGLSLRKNGAPVLRYTGLTAMDAKGQVYCPRT